ncbi:hypothetical protein [Microvirga puerhi]|uniref:Uncharacterized protein n=1 Tax=Microvirga puerhi TaxID=2876078 RepID=A0ABS7VT97_9HYPH|nr:hypothetical protein [Microvirga puerhi]MBZ6078300.1 hypothetical protein [Microvirga puerhi]
MARIIQTGRMAALAVTVLLGACQTDSFSSNGSPEGVPIALESIDGAPPPVRTALINELTTAAADRKVELVGSAAQARYRVRGYLSTETVNGETKVAYVWDVFDSEQRRAKRLTGTSPGKVAGKTISASDKETLAKLANASMDEIAEFLSAAGSATPIQTAANVDSEAVAAQ